MPARASPLPVAESESRAAPSPEPVGRRVMRGPFCAREPLRDQERAGCETLFGKEYGAAKRVFYLLATLYEPEIARLNSMPSRGSFS